MFYIWISLNMVYRRKKCFWYNFLVWKEFLWCVLKPFGFNPPCLPFLCNPEEFWRIDYVSGVSVKAMTMFFPYLLCCKKDDRGSVIPIEESVQTMEKPSGCHGGRYLCRGNTDVL